MSTYYRKQGQDRWSKMCIPPCGLNDASIGFGCKISRRYSASERVAYQNYEIAIQLCPGFIRPCELMGNIHRKEGRAEKAIELFTKAVELNREPICGPWFPMPHGRCTPLFGRLEGEGEFLFFVAKEK